MDADHRRAAAKSGGDRRERPHGARRSGLPTCEMPDECFPRCHDHDRAQLGKAMAPRQKVEILIEGFGESDSGIDGDLIYLDPRADRLLAKPAQLAKNV